MSSKITSISIKNRKQKLNVEAARIVATTAYDYTLACIADAAGVDLILVGDSASGVIQGASIPLHITLEEMIYHCRCVMRAQPNALVVGDLPFMSYQVSPKQALKSAGRLVKEGQVEAVKLEGGANYYKSVTRIVQAGIPVVGHIGLTPQHFHAFGGFRVQGRQDNQAQQLKEDAIALWEAGATLIVLEGIPANLSAEITDSIDIPTIGIGAGPHCDGQIMVIHDLLGLTVNSHRPKFVKQYAHLKNAATLAIQEYKEEVRAGSFPSPEFTYK